METLDILRFVAVPVIVAVLSSGAFSAMINKRIERKNDIAKLAQRCDAVIRNCDRQAEGLSVVMESMELLLEVMHEKGLINGESEHVRSSINNYLMTCTERGLYMTERK